MPADLATAIYLLMIAIIIVLMAVIAWFLKAGFDELKTRLGSIDAQMVSIGAEVRVERESRIRNYERVWGEIKYIKKMCDMRHHETLNTHFEEPVLD